MKRVVGVLRGGPSSEYEVSLRSGATVLGSLPQEKYEPRDIFVSREGAWHRGGLEMPPGKALQGVDVVWVAIHGQYGEDGTVQRLLDSMSIPYVGSNAFASALAFDKHRAKEALGGAGVKLPRHILIEAPQATEERLLEIFRTFPHPTVVKPRAAGSSVGVTIARDFHTLKEGLERAFAVSPKALIEEYIKGREATVGVVEGLRGEELYALLPTEIIPPAKNGFFDYDAKYSGGTRELTPGNFSREEKDELQRAARAAHRALGLSHYSRSDFIVSRRGIYLLETNNAGGVGFTQESLLPKALTAVGVGIPEFLDHIIGLALER